MLSSLSRPDQTADPSSCARSLSARVASTRLASRPERAAIEASRTPMRLKTSLALAKSPCAVDHSRARPHHTLRATLRQLPRCERLLVTATEQCGEPLRRGAPVGPRRERTRLQLHDNDPRAVRALPTQRLPPSRSAARPALRSASSM